MMKRTSQPDSRNVASQRRGIVMLWLIITVPALFFLFGAIIDVSRVWLARIELTNALEAAALSGVKTWGQAGMTGNDSTLRGEARADAVTAAAANTVIGQTQATPADAVIVTLDPNGESGGTNGNTSTAGELVLGQLTPNGTGFSFDANTSPATNDEFGVRTQKMLTIYSIWSSLFGIPLGPYSVTSGAVAIYDDTIDQPRIVFVNNYIP